MLGGMAAPFNAELSQFHTPVKLARRIVDWAGVAGKRVLEPSAGGGNIVRELVRAGASQIVAVEIDLLWCEAMASEFYSCKQSCEQLRIIQGDFTALVPAQLDLAVANPPLDGGVGGHHVRHMLNWVPRAVSVMRGQDLHGGERYRELWSDCDLARIAFLSARPRYRNEGGKIETVVVDVYRKGTYSGVQSIEHWADRWD
jgi:hypothetical protein